MDPDRGGTAKAMALAAISTRLDQSPTFPDKSFLSVRSSVNWPADHFFRPKAKEGL